MTHRHFFIAALITFVAACADEKVAKRSYPVVDTFEVTEITDQGVTFEGEILDLGDGIAEHGFVFDHGTIGGSPFQLSATRIPLGTIESPSKFTAFANRGLAAGETYNVRAYAIDTKGTIVVGQQRKFVGQGSLGPEIKDFNPKEAAIGDILVITGIGFNNVLFNNKVFIGAAASVITKAKADTLWVRMPDGASAGDNSLVVQVGQQSVTSSQKVKLLPITITSIEPALVFLGDTIIIRGTNFPTADPLTRVKMFDASYAVYKPTRTQLKTVLLEEPSKANSQVELVAGTQTVKSTSEVKLFPPKITSITPVKGSKDTEVTISGDYFHSTPTKNTVLLGTTNMTITSTVSRTMLKFKVPGGLSSGYYNISVTTIGQTTVSVPKFEILQPVITSISPANGTWGTELVINGSNFGATIADNTVEFRAISESAANASILSASETQLKVKVPNNLFSESSTIRVTVKSAENRIAEFNSFVLNPPLISSFAPGAGKIQSVATINGSNFHPTIAGNVVTFGDQVAEVTEATSTQITVKVPVMADANVIISVTTFDRTATSLNPFHVISPWRRIKDFPGTERSNAVSFVLNNEGYVGLGSVAGNIKTFYKYNPTTDAWTEVQAYSTDSPSAFVDGTAFEIGGIGYVGKGSPEPSVFRKYDPVSNTWTTIAPLPVTNVSNSVGFAIGGKGYIATGSVIANTGGVPCCSGTSRTWEYDPVANTWTEKNFLPTIGRTGATAFTVNSRAFVFGGLSHTESSVPFVDLFEFLPAANTWEQRASFPPGRWNFPPISFGLNGKGYILAGGAGFNAARSASIVAFDPATNTWQALPNHPVDFRDNAVTFVIGNKAYVGLGNAVQGSTKVFWEFDPSKL